MRDPQDDMRELQDDMRDLQDDMRDLQNGMRDLHDDKILLHVDIQVMIDLLGVISLPANIIDIDLHHLTVIIAGDLILDAPAALIVNLVKTRHIKMYLILTSRLI